SNGPLSFIACWPHGCRAAYRFGILRTSERYGSLGKRLVHVHGGPDVSGRPRSNRVSRPDKDDLGRRGDLRLDLSRYRFRAFTEWKRYDDPSPPDDGRVRIYLISQLDPSIQSRLQRRKLRECDPG